MDEDELLPVWRFLIEVRPPDNQLLQFNVVLPPAHVYDDSVSWVLEDMAKQIIRELKTKDYL